MNIYVDGADISREEIQKYIKLIESHYPGRSIQSLNIYCTAKDDYKNVTLDWEFYPRYRMTIPRDMPERGISFSNIIKW